MSVVDKMEKLVESTYTDCERCFAVRGSDSMIDVVNPRTGRSWIRGRSLEEIRAEAGYEKAELMTVAEFCVEKAARQDTPIVWDSTTEETYYDMLNVLPPEIWLRGWFLVGEPCDHHAATGQPRFSAFRSIHGRYECANRPLTKAELKKEMEAA